MNVFILCTGRCGSTTFIKACKHITNYTSSHELRSHIVGDLHFHYPINHIEADNRLSWFLGRLECIYGNNAFWVHLKQRCKGYCKKFPKKMELWNHKSVQNRYFYGNE